jgi:C4-dicarboxylate-specific signal transduction histidine kinase
LRSDHDGELAASIAHEVNQPIAGVLTNETPVCAGCKVRELGRPHRSVRHRRILRRKVGRATSSGAFALFKKAETAKVVLAR